MTSYFNNNPKYRTIFPVVRYCGGPLYYLSSKSIAIFKNKEKIVKFLAEDIMVGYNLNHNGIEPSKEYNLYGDVSTQTSCFIGVQFIPVMLPVAKTTLAAKRKKPKEFFPFELAIIGIKITLKIQTKKIVITSPVVV